MVTAAMLGVGAAGGAGADGYGSFIAGFLIGAGITFILGPAVRSWLAYREWADASRQARLTDEILARMQREDRRNRHGERGPAPDDMANPPGPWPASR
jgi:hypothetical protein